MTANVAEVLAREESWVPHEYAFLEHTVLPQTLHLLCKLDSSKIKKQVRWNRLNGSFWAVAFHRASAKLVWAHLSYRWNPRFSIPSTTTGAIIIEPSTTFLKTFWRLWQGFGGFSLVLGSSIEHISTFLGWRTCFFRGSVTRPFPHASSLN